MARSSPAAAAARRRRGGALLLAPLLLLLLPLLAPAAAQSADAAAQAAALRQIGDALGPTRGGFSADPAANDPCDAVAFPGVACDANGQVTSLSLAGRPLFGGALPDSPSTWAALPGLRTLDASGAGLTGPLPSAGLSAAPNLANVNLSGNDFEGSAGALAPPSLETLNLSGNARLCGDVAAAVAGKTDVTGTASGTACDQAGVAAADDGAAVVAPKSPAPEAAAAAADDAAPAPAEPAATATSPAYCVCGTAGLDSQGCKDEVYNSCDAAKTATPVASCGDLQSGDAARVRAAVDRDCGAAAAAVTAAAAAVTAAAAASPSPSPPPAGSVAEVAPPGSLPPPPPPVAISNAPVCAACAVRGFASPDCTGALQSLCATPGAAPPDVCSALPAAAQDAEAAKSSARALGGYLERECFSGSSSQAADPCACFSAGVSTSDCAQARVQLCARGDAMCLPFQALSGAPAGAGAGGQADALLAEAARYGKQSCPVAAPERPGVQAGLTFAGVGVSEYASGYSQGVANALSQVTGVPNSGVQLVDVRPSAEASSSSSGAGRRLQAAARRFLLQQSTSSSAAQATYFLQSADPEAVARKLQQSAQDGSLVTALGNNGVSGTPSLSIKSYLPAGSLDGEVGEGAGKSNSGFPLWALAPIIVGLLLLLGLLVGLLICCRRRRAQRRAKALPEGGKLVVGGAAAAAAAAGAAGGAASRGDKAAPAAAVPTAATTAAAPTAYSTDPYADPYAPRTTGATVERSGSAALSAALGGGTTPAAPVVASSGGGAGVAAGVGAAAAGAGLGAAAMASASGRRSGSGVGGKDIQSVPLPAPARPPSASAAAPSASEWRTGSGAGASSSSQQQQQQQQQPRSGGGAAAAALGAGAAAGAAGAAASGSGEGGRSSAQQAERAKFWAQFQESWQQVRQSKAQRDADEPGTPSSGTQWTDQ